MNIPLNFTFASEAQADAAIGLLARAFDYRATLADGTPNPESPLDFAKGKLKDVLKGYIERQAKAEADAAVAAKVDAALAGITVS